MPPKVVVYIYCVFPDKCFQFSCLLFPKTARVTPIFKADSKVDPLNYRLILALSVTANFFEKAIFNQVTAYLDENNLHLQHLAIGKVPFCLVAILAYTTSLFRDIMPSRKDSQNTGNFTSYSFRIVCGLKF